MAFELDHVTRRPLAGSGLSYNEDGNQQLVFCDSVRVLDTYGLFASV